jgi:hypothetical protein
MWTLSKRTEKSLSYRNSNTGEECKWNQIYDHGELGKFYAIDNLLQLSYQRKFIFDLAQQYERIGIEKTELITHTDKILTLLKEKPVGHELEIFAMVQRINNTCKDSWDYLKTAMMIIPVLIIQEGDDIGAFDQESAQERIKIWSQDKTMMAFFLNAANSLCSKVSN